MILRRKIALIKGTIPPSRKSGGKNILVRQKLGSLPSNYICYMDTNVPEISELLKPMFSATPQVQSAVLFGSLVTGELTPQSDVDIAIYVQEPSTFSFRDRLALRGDCCRALKRNDIDLVVMNQMKNLILLETIIRTNIVIYTTNQNDLDIFFVDMLHRAIDFRFQRTQAIGI